MDDEKKICRNCRYFSEHYFIYRDRLKAAGCGNCLNSRAHRNKRHYNALNEGCEFWESEKIRKTVQKERVEDTLRDMKDRLSQILKILQIKN